MWGEKLLRRMYGVQGHTMAEHAFLVQTCSKTCISPSQGTGVPPQSTKGRGKKGSKMTFQLCFLNEGTVHPEALAHTTEQGYGDRRQINPSPSGFLHFESHVSGWLCMQTLAANEAFCCVNPGMAPVFIATWRIWRPRMERTCCYPATPKTLSCHLGKQGGPLRVLKSII